MIAARPDTAPKRPDLVFLRRRTRAAVVPPPPPVPAPPPAAPVVTPPPSTSLDLGAPAAPAPVSSSLDLGAPAAPAPVSSSLDLGSPPPPAPSASASLDLGAPPPPPPVSSSLDLSGAPPPPLAPPRSPAVRTPPPARAPAGRQTLLTPKSPTVTLTRVQSGIGTLTFDAAVSDAVGDLRLGAAYQLRSGESSTVERTGERRVAPPGSRRPVIVAGRERYEQLVLDLRQSRELERLIVYAFSESRAPLTWGGTLVTTTFGGADIELPLETLQGGDVAVLLSLYNVRGEFVLRAEMQTLWGSIREACRAYGYDRITWLDDRTPVD